jgi:hypothetical protein
MELDQSQIDDPGKSSKPRLSVKNGRKVLLNNRVFRRSCNAFVKLTATEFGKLVGQSIRFGGSPNAQQKESKMSIKWKIQKHKKEVRREMVLAIRQFCRKMNLKVDKLSDTIQFIADTLDQRDPLIISVALCLSETGPTELDLFKEVAEYLADFSQEMDEWAAEFTALSQQAKDELEKLNHRG